MKNHGFKTLPVEVNSMRTILLIELLFLLIISCRQEPGEYFNRAYIQTFYHPDSSKNYFSGDSTESIPAPDDTKRVFVVVDSDRIALVSRGSLAEIYKRYYPSVNFYNFMDEALNQKTVFPSRMIPVHSGRLFRLNKAVTEAYQQNGSELLVKDYFEKTESGYRLKPLGESHQKLTVLYYVFLSGYEVLYDEYQGQYSIRQII